MDFYDIVVHAGYPLRRWGRLGVEGRELIPVEGPVIVVANHDSMLDPVAVVGACHPRRNVRFLAMAELWRNPAIRFVLERMGHIPIDRGGGGETAIREAIRALKRGEAIAIFPEGKLSRGRQLPARGGVARLASECPSAPILLAAVTGADDVVRFPKRPRATVSFFAPRPAPPGERAAELPARLLAEIRAVAPPVPAGRSGRAAAWLRKRRAARARPSARVRGRRASRRSGRLDQPPGRAAVEGRRAAMGAVVRRSGRLRA